MKWTHLGLLYLVFLAHFRMGGSGADLAWHVALYGGALWLLETLWKLCRWANQLGASAAPGSDTNSTQPNKQS